MSRISGPGRAWRALGVFWLVVLAGTAGTAAWLQSQGPVAPHAGRPLPAALPPLQPAAPMPPPASSAPAAEAPAALAPAREIPASLPPTAPPQPQPPAASIQAEPPAAGPAAAPPEPPAAAEPESPPLPPEPNSEAQAPAPARLPDAPLPPPLPSQSGRPADRAAPIPPPDPALLEGPLPRIAADGRQPRQAYARAMPEAAAGQPRIAIAIAGFGLSPSRSEEALRRLPPETGLGFSPLAQRPERLLEQARGRGMESLLALPGEAGAEGADLSLRPGLPADLAEARLLQSLGRFAGYVGVLAPSQPRAERAPLSAELQAVLRQRGLLALQQPGAGPAPLGGATADLLLDEPLTRGEVDRRLAELEALARQRGQALGLAAEPAPLLVDRIAAWAATLPERGILLVPVSALAQPGTHSAAR